jgi:CRP/FNR family cyclic AMP-dependent transcriptional regulator
MARFLLDFLRCGWCRSYINHFTDTNNYPTQLISGRAPYIFFWMVGSVGAAMQETSFLKENQRVFNDVRKFEIFEPFQDEELRHLIAMSKIRKYKSGETIFEQGSADTWLYFLIYGKVKLLKDDKQVVLLQQRGDVFGEMGAIECAPRSASAIAEGETVCLAADIYYIEQLSGVDKLAFGYITYRVLSSILAARLRSTTKNLMELKGRSIKIY